MLVRTIMGGQVLSAKVFYGALCIMGLAVCDVVFTLRHLEVGATEANPLMNWVLHSLGLIPFVVSKLVLTIIGVFGLVSLYDSVRFARISFWAILNMYIVLMFYHIVLAFTCW